MLGWIGSLEELKMILINAQCDLDEDGKLKVDGPINSFLGAGDEYVVSPGAVFYREGVARDFMDTAKGSKIGLLIEVF